MPDPRQLSFPTMPAPPGGPEQGEFPGLEAPERLAPGLKSWRGVLAPSVPLARWLKTASPYTWRVEKRAPTPAPTVPENEQE